MSAAARFPKSSSRTKTGPVGARAAGAAVTPRLSHFLMKLPSGQRTPTGNILFADREARLARSFVATRSGVVCGDDRP